MVNKGVWTSPKGPVEVAVKTLQGEASQCYRATWNHHCGFSGEFIVAAALPVAGYMRSNIPFTLQMMIILELMAKGDLRSFFIQNRTRYIYTHAYCII